MVEVVFVDTFIDFARGYYELGKGLRKLGFGVAHFTYSRECYNFYRGKGVKVVYLVDEFKCLGKVKFEDYGSYLKGFEEEYGVSINSLLSMDNDYSFVSERKALRGVIDHFRFWESYINSSKDDVVFIGGKERLMCLVPFYVSLVKKRLSFINIGVTPLVDGGFWLNNNPFGVFDDLEKNTSNYDDVLVDDFIDNSVNSKKGSYKGIGVKPFNNYFYLLKRLFINILVEKNRNPYANIVKLVSDEFKRFFNDREEFFGLKKLSNKKYFYFPLHKFDDAQIIVNNPEYYDQVSLLEFISKCLPYDYELWVKSHPNAPGSITMSDTHRLMKNKNIRLINPKLNSYDLIKGSEGVIVINSTVGLESALLGKKPIVLGNPFYSMEGITINVKNLNDMSQVIRDSVKNNKVYNEVLKSFISRYLHSCKKGHILFYKKYFNKTINENNIKMVCETINKKIKR